MRPFVIRWCIASGFGGDGKTKAGDLVAVYHEPPDEDLRPAPPPVGTGGELLGYGLYNPRSEIAVRMLRYGPQLPDEAFWQNLLVQAVRLRRELLQIDQVSNAYRVIHAEADGLPGLVVDRFGDFLSAEVFSLGMFQRSEAIVRRLLPLCDAQHYLIRTAPHVLAHEGFESPDLASESAPQVVLITEHRRETTANKDTTTANKDNGQQRHRPDLEGLGGMGRTPRWISREVRGGKGCDADRSRAEGR